MEAINLFFSSTHGTLIFLALGGLFVVSTVLSLSGRVRNGKKGFASEKHGIIASFFLILIGARYTSSWTTYFWILVGAIILSYMIGYPNLGD